MLKARKTTGVAQYSLSTKWGTAFYTPTKWKLQGTEWLMGQIHAIDKVIKKTSRRLKAKRMSMNWWLIWKRSAMARQYNSSIKILIWIKLMKKQCKKYITISQSLIRGKNWKSLMPQKVNNANRKINLKRNGRLQTISNKRKNKTRVVNIMMIVSTWGGWMSK